MPTKPTVCVAMSGGVDSSVVPLILKKRGYDVIGVTMQIWQESQKDPRHAGCCSLGAVEDARRVARIIGMPHYVINFKDQFKKTVIDEFVDEYSKGRTPNPCVTCNRRVKFDALLKTMKDLGCDFLATGHYARIRRSPNGRYRLMRSRGGEKDQSYVLYATSQEQLSQVMFPLGELGSKAETRNMAREAGLPVADKPDSQEICFVSEAGGYREFLRKAKPSVFEEGEVVNSAGEVIATHHGVADFTIGQRKGIGVAVGSPLYVLKIQPEENRVIVGTEDELGVQEVTITDPIWSSYDAFDAPRRVKAKIRYNMQAQPATLYAGNTPRIVFDQPVRAVTPGQIAVAYKGESVVMGGTIR